MPRQPTHTAPSAVNESTAPNMALSGFIFTSQRIPSHSFIT